MKKSKALELEASMEENDLKALGILCKALRESRSEKFVDGWLKPLEMRYPVVYRNNGSYSISTFKYGIIDYFPKANNLLIRKKNKWKKPGLRWIIKNLLNNE